MREAVLAHHGEAEASGAAFRALPKYDQDSIIEFLKSLQILPAGAKSLCVDQDGKDVDCPPRIQPWSNRRDWVLSKEREQLRPVPCRSSQIR